MELFYFCRRENPYQNWSFKLVVCETCKNTHAIYKMYGDSSTRNAHKEEENLSVYTTPTIPSGQNIKSVKLQTGSSTNRLAQHSWTRFFRAWNGFSIRFPRSLQEGARPAMLDMFFMGGLVLITICVASMFSEAWHGTTNDLKLLAPRKDLASDLVRKRCKCRWAWAGAPRGICWWDHWRPLGDGYERRGMQCGGMQLCLVY